ncbi:hypothetical protein V6N13_106144 [Hibiscus sabdariffa]|uniref:Uncharacterized protein n=1 Tax=Hibiscus sabdariffa TaxID=183260 RepID=A0ABR2EZU5_9ROSI
MICGESCLVLKLVQSGTKIHFNAFDALFDWKHEALPPVEVPAAAQWKFRRIFRIVIVDDFVVIVHWDQHGREEISDSMKGLQVVLYEDELSDNEMSLLTVKVLNKGYPTDSASYCDPSIFSQKLPVIMHRIQRLIFCNNL